ACAAGQCKALEFVSSHFLGSVQSTGSYEADFGMMRGGAAFLVTQPGGAAALAVLPADFAITTPSPGQSFSTRDSIRIAWQPAAPVPVSWSWTFDGACALNGDSLELPGDGGAIDSTSLTIPAGTFSDDVRSRTCGIKLLVTAKASGRVDSGFKPLT